MTDDKVNILLVDDQPAKLLTYQAILRDLDETIVTAGSAREALEYLLKSEVAVVLIDVYMPETDGFELAKMIREHPRFQRTAIIFISAVLLTEMDRVRGYESGAVDYVPVPVVPEVLRAKVKVFVELYRKTRQLEQLNRELEARVAERTVELASSTMKLRQSEQLRSLALAAGQMGSWEWDGVHDEVTWDQGQYNIFGVDPDTFVPTQESIRALIHPEDAERLMDSLRSITSGAQTIQVEFRVSRPNGELRYCTGAMAGSFDQDGRMIRLSGVTVDITERKAAEERQTLLAEEVDHRARNVVTVVQSVMRLTRAGDIESYIAAVDGRIRALSNAHRLLSNSRWEGADLATLAVEELAPYRTESQEKVRISGPAVMLKPATAQTLALVLHELATNAAKYGALSAASGTVELRWQNRPGALSIDWIEAGGPPVSPPQSRGYGTRVIETGIQHQLDGEVDFNWYPSGLHCALLIPSHDKVGLSKNGPEKPTSPTAEKEMNGLRVLLVEDEPLVAMMLADMLEEQGFSVDGPYGNLSEAAEAVRSNDFQVAILDINLRGELIYDLANALDGRRIPFVFVTGYSAESVDPRFAQVPVLQKPVEWQKLRGILSGILGNYESADRLGGHTQDGSTLTTSM